MCVCVCVSKREAEWGGGGKSLLNDLLFADCAEGNTTGHLW